MRVWKHQWGAPSCFPVLRGLAPRQAGLSTTTLWAFLHDDGIQVLGAATSTLGSEGSPGESPSRELAQKGTPLGPRTSGPIKNTGWGQQGAT